MTDTTSAEQSVFNLIEIAKEFEKRKKFELADQVLQAVKTLMEPTLGTTHSLYLDCLYHLAVCNQKLGRSAIGRDAIIHYMELLNHIVADIHSDTRWVEAFHLLGELSC
jgi:hypothetical protein